MFTATVLSILIALSVLRFLFRRNLRRLEEPRDQPSTALPSRPRDKHGDAQYSEASASTIGSIQSASLSFAPTPFESANPSLLLLLQLYLESRRSLYRRTYVFLFVFIINDIRYSYSQGSKLPNLYPVFPRDGSKGNTTVDIIAVHGIETCSPTTWTAYERDTEPRGRKINWLVDEDMLPHVVPEAQIWVFDYNSRYTSDAQIVRIKALGEVFLQFIWNNRDKLGTRPILFIGSCFGGIVVAQALQRAACESSKYKQLLQSTKGIIFLGTPLRGTRAKSAAEWRVFISGIIGRDHETSTTLIEDLKENSSSLENLVEDFGKLTIEYEIEIRCFYETRKTQILNAVLNKSVSKLVKSTKYILVEKGSACLDCHERIPLEARHAMMNKYRRPNDGNFKLVSGSIREIFQKTRDVQQRTAEQLKCLRSLSRNYREHKDANPKRVPGTCQWLLSHEKFHKWRCEDTETLLLVSADPGCGKSVLSRTLVDERLVTLDETSVRTYNICYFFFKDGDTERRSGANALCATLHQLFTHRPALLKYAMADFENNGDKLCDMFGTLWDILMKAVVDPEAGQVVCILDALDECEESARRDLIQKLGSFSSDRRQTKAKLKFLVTSRPYTDIKRTFGYTVQDLPSINLEGEKESDAISKEINLVIEDQVPRIARARHPPIEENIKDHLIEHLKGMNNRTYLWLHLILDEIQKSLESSQGKLRKLIKEIPLSIEAAYERILNRVTEPKLVEQARRLLHLVVSAERPLTLQEMNIALAIIEKEEDGKNCESKSDLELDPLNAFETKVRSLCGLFISIIDLKVYLIHQTAREFLVNNHHIDIPSNLARTDTNVWKHSLSLEDSNLLMAKVCISYLLFTVFEIHPLETEAADRYHKDGWFHFRGTIEQYCNEHGFLDYAAKHWASHFREAKIKDETPLFKSILKVCNTRSNHFLTWFQVYWTTVSFYSLFPRSFTDLIVGSYFGHQAVVRLLLKKGADVRAQDGDGRTPLSWAAGSGHEAVVKLLFEIEGVEADSKDNEGRTPLSWAAGRGHEAVVKLLLEIEGVEADSKDNRGRTPLSRAAERGHEVVVKLLLEIEGVEADSKDIYGQTPLSWAAERRHEDNYSQTPLSRAAGSRHEAVVKLLLETEGVEADSKDNEGQTPL